METAKKSFFCRECASKGVLAPRYCPKHTQAPENCQHEDTSPTIIHNGEGIVCNDCGLQIGIVTVS
jgi:DNA-directed RNA polymerase subunit RPC12/RpoP